MSTIAFSWSRPPSVNFGIAEQWELVIEDRNFLLVHPVGAGRRDTLRETAMSLKGLLR